VVASPHSWGRVADDGTVYVRLAGGEQPVGSWLAGDAAAGLTFYARRYEALAVDIELLGRRIAEDHLAPDDAMAKIGKLRQQVDSPQCVGDLTALSQQLDGLVQAVDSQRQARQQQRQAAREQVRAEREQMVAEAERLADSTRWKVAGDRFRALVEEWKAAPRLDRSGEQELWHRFSAARATFDRRRRAHFAQVEEQRHDAAVTKQRLVKEAEGLATSKDWQTTSRRFRDLMAQWKAAGPADRDEEQQLWAAFRTAQDTFFTARNEVLAARDADFVANLEKKQAVVAEAESLLPVTDPKDARQRLRGLQDRFAAIGMVPRSDKEAIENRMRAVEQAVRKSEESQWRRTNPEARARARATVDQLETSLAKLRGQRDAAEAAADAAQVAEVSEAIAAREGWLAQAQAALEEFSG